MPAGRCPGGGNDATARDLDLRLTPRQDTAVGHRRNTVKKPTTMEKAVGRYRTTALLSTLAGGRLRVTPTSFLPVVPVTTTAYGVCRCPRAGHTP